MKKYYTTIQIILAFLLTGFISAAQQEKMPLTSGSGSAVELYYEATAALENAELARGEILLNEALKKDPEFFMGLFHLAANNLYSGNINKFKKCAESAFISYCAYSEGEKIIQEALKRLYENPKADVTDLSRKLLQLYPEDKLVKYIQLTFQTIQEDYAGIPDETFLHSKPLIETSNSNQFRGTNCCGVAPASAHPPISLVPDENLVWKTEIANGVSSPCVWDNFVFLTGYEPLDRLLITYCINKETGAILWEKSVWPDSIEPVHPVGSPATATPVTDGKHVYVYFGSYGVVCYDFEGNLAWEKKLPVLKTRYGSCASPVILKDKLILNRFEVDNPVILALEPSTGKTIWKTKLSTIPGLTEALQRSQSTPVLWNDQIILHRSLTLISVNIEDGRENWSIPLVSMGSSTPVILNDVLYVNGYSNLGEARLYDRLPDFQNMVVKHDENNDGLIQFQEIPEDLAFFRRPDLDLPLKYDTLFSWNLMAPSFDISQDKALNEQEWKGMEQFWSQFYENHGVVAIDLKNARTNTADYLWKENEFIAEIPSLLCTGKQVYMISNGGLVTCMNAETGEVIYREKLGAPGAYIASPLMANGNIYFASYSGRITVVKPDDKLRVISQCNLKGKVAASPVASEKKLIVRTDKELYAFGE